MVEKLKDWLSRFYIGIIMLFLYFPIGVLIVMSFNASRSRVNWGGFSFTWYAKLFSNVQILSALRTTIILALLAAGIATIFGTMGALGIHAMRRKNFQIMMAFTNIPMVNADIVTGIALMLWFIHFMKLGFTSLLLSHITFCIPYVILSVMPKLKQMNISTYEAARDLGAGPVYAFRKILLPQIASGIVSGFFMAFTMSMDDFVITYFTKGPGVDTLSTLIYGEIKKGIKPEMYALSTLIFVTVFAILLLVNYLPDAMQKRKKSTKKVYATLGTIMAFACIGLIVMLGGTSKKKGSITVCNYGEYIEPEILTQFTEETGIEVKYEEALTPEDMYTKYKSGGANYDIVCTSDYMLERLINEGELQKIDMSTIEYSENINQKYWDFAKSFDPKNEYTIPYFWGTVGILYNTKKVKGEIDSWDVLFNGEYAGDIIMQNSMRDSYMVALKYLGYSMNTTNPKEIKEAQELLLKQKPDVQAYLVDEVRDEIVSENATMGVIYSGEAYLGKEYNEDLAYVVPKEGSNVWLDCWGMTRHCENTEAAKEFLGFLCREDIAMKNFEYVYYPTPNDKVFEQFSEEELEDETLVPPESATDNCEVSKQLDAKTTELLNKYWKELKAN